MNTLDGFRLVGFTQGKVARDADGTQNRFHRWVAKLTHSDVGTSVIDERTRVRGTMKVAVLWLALIGLGWSQSASAFVEAARVAFDFMES